MKAQDIAKLHASSTKELEANVKKAQKELVEAKMYIKLGKEKNTKKAFNLRKEIAITKTIIREKQLATKQGK